MKKIIIILVWMIIIIPLYTSKSYTNASMGIVDSYQQQQQQQQSKSTTQPKSNSSSSSSSKSKSKSSSQGTSTQQDEPDTDTSATGISDSAADFISRGQKEDILPMDKITSDLFPVGRTVVAIAILVLLVTGMILGLKYMISGTDEKAKMKERLIWYIVAAVMIFGAVGIYNMVASIVNSVGI